MPGQDLSKRLQPPVEEPPSTEALLLETAKKLEPKEVAKNDPEADGSTPEDREYRFFFESENKEISGWFTHRVPNMADQQRIGVMLSQLQGSVPWASIPSDLRLLNRGVAYLSVTLVKRPANCVNLQALTDRDAIMALWEVGVSHDATFHRPRPHPRSGPQTA